MIATGRDEPVMPDYQTTPPPGGFASDSGPATEMLGAAAGPLRCQWCSVPLASGVTMTSTLLAKDTSHRNVFPVFAAGGGLGELAGRGHPDFQRFCRTKK